MKFKSRYYEEVKDFICCELKWDMETNIFLLHQLTMINKLELKMKPYMENFKINSKKVHMVKVLGIRQMTNEDKLLYGEMKSFYRSCVGSLLYITKHSRPDLFNSVRELSKLNKRSFLDNFCCFTNCFSFLFENKNLGVRLVKSYMDEHW